MPLRPYLVQPNEAAGGLPERSDDELMRLAKAGSREAFAVLVERHSVRVHALCSRFVDDAQLGQELAQDTWVMAWQRRDKHRGGAFKPWLITVARNHCRNHLRHRRVVDRHRREPAPSDGQLSPEQIDRLLLEERRDRVREALHQLPGTLREALLLRYAEDLHYDEMAEVLGVSPGTLRSRVHHGLKALRKALGRDA